jgi:hypothetical protein
MLRLRFVRVVVYADGLAAQKSAPICGRL